MNEKEKFDDLLRSKLSERDFPFDETNWDKAEALIERSERRRRIAFISVIFLAGILVGVGIMYPFIHTATPVTLSDAQLPQQSNTSSVQNQNNTAISQTNTSTQATNSSSVNTAITNSQAITKSDNSSKQADNQSATNNSTANSNNSITESDVHLTVIKEKATHTTSSKHNKHKVKPDSTAQYSYVRPVSEKVKKNKQNRDLLANNNSQIQSATVSPGIPSTHTNKQPESQNSKTSNDNASQTNPSVASNNQQDNNTLQTSTTPTSAGQNNIPTTNSVKDSTTKKDSNTALVTNTTPVVKKPDTTASQTTSTQQAKTTSKYSHTLVSVDAGGAYAFGWMKAGATQGNGLNPILGLSATHYFSTKLSVLLGLHYNSLGNINTLNTINNTQYDFGAENNYTSVTIKTLYYLAVPLQIQYNINDKNIISAGINACYFVNDNSNVVSYTQNYFGKSGNVSNTEMGYTDGINPLDVQVMLAYRRKINRFTISAEGYYGLMDIESNYFFGNDITFERNSGLRLLLSYDIIK